ncbi:MAG: DUF6443 domain-containing protein [Flavobacteriales bacterium]|nr:DUF6443 domain-containing protein [Flavobacteriales bacterium]
MISQINRVLLILVTFFHLASHAQNNYENLASIPVSPEASSILKFESVPVSPYTGTPNINIPIHVFQNSEITIPVSLSYHGSGIKVAEEASWAGLGWALNAGGVINQTIRGLDDNQSSFGTNDKRHIPLLPSMVPGGCNYCGPYAQGVYPQNGKATYSTVACSNKNPCAVWEWTDNGISSSANFDNLKSDITGNIYNFDSYLEESYDWESDLYSFNFLSYSGKFIFDQNNQIILLDGGDIKIVEGDLNNSAQTEGFTIITPEGHQFYFGEIQETRPQPYVANSNNVVNRSYYLSKIKTYLGKNIYFNYDVLPAVTNLDVLNETRYAVGVYGMQSTGNNQTASYSVTEYQPVYLQSIVYKNKEVRLSHTSRIDFPGTKKLSKIEVRSQNQVQKTILLHQSYFEGLAQYGNYLPTPSNQNFLNRLAKRLRLDSIQHIYPNTDTLTHKFNYNNGDLPFKTAYAVDYWGYFNGVKTNESLIPDFSRYYINNDDPATWATDPLDIKSWNGANRNPDENYSKMAMLEEIIYPTGGSSRFDFEMHDYSNILYENPFEYKGSAKVIAVDVNDVNANNPNESFNIQGDKQLVHFKINLACYNTSCLNYSPGNSNAPRVSLISTNGGATPISHWGLQDVDASGNLEVRKWLSPGSYAVQAFLPNTIGGISQGIAQIEVNYTVYGDSVYHFKGGGHRIAKITTYDGLSHQNDMVKTFQYNYQDQNNNLFSYGKLMAQPKFMNIAYREYHAPRVYDFNGNWVNGGTNDFGKKLSLSSNSFRPLIATTGGSYIGYSQVVEAFQDSAAGKTLYRFHNETPTGNAYNGKNSSIHDIPNPLNGLVKEKLIISDKLDTVSRLVQVYDTSNVQINKMIHLERDVPNNYNNTDDVCSRCHIYLHHYNVLSSRVQLMRSDETLDGVTTSTEFAYSAGHSLPIETSIVNSDSVKYITRNTYVGDFPCESNCAPFGSAGYEIHQLYKQNRKHILLETTKWVKESNNGLTRITHGSIQEYKSYGSNIALSGIRKLHLYGPSMPTNAFNELQVDQNFDLNWDSRYENHTEMTLDYDAHGNLIQYQKAFDVPKSLIYDDNNHVIAEVTNADVAEVAFANFETAAGGGWTMQAISNSNDAKSGLKSGQFHQGIILKTGLPSGAYILSFWTKDQNLKIKLNGQVIASHTSGNVFERFEKAISMSQTSNVISIESNAGFVDDLKIYPGDALMSNFIFDNEKELLQASISENEIYSFYEYDGMSRLIAAKNDDGAINSFYEYKYNPVKAINEAHQYTCLVDSIFDIPTALGKKVDEVAHSVSYSDGLGRVIQEIDIQASPKKKDIISFHEYDHLGRETKQYLPYTAYSNGTGKYRKYVKIYQNLFYGGAYANNKFAYSETEFEGTPLNRINKIGQPGESWAIGNGHELRTERRTNFIYEVPILRNGTLKGYYPPESLFVEENYNEDGHKTTTFKDKLGRVIMSVTGQRRLYNVYDLKGRLQVIITPKAMHEMLMSGNYSYYSNTYKPSLFEYGFDKRDRLINKNIPGKGVERMYYDRLDRLVLTRDANDNKKVIKYDVLGRVIMSGSYSGNLIPSNNEDLFEIRQCCLALPGNGTGSIGYSNSNSFPKSGFIPEIITYYDNYDFDRDSIEDANESFEANNTGEYSESPYMNQRGQVTGSRIGLFGEDGFSIDRFLLSRSYFNKKAHVILSIEDNTVSGQDKTYFQSSFTGEILKQRKVHRAVIAPIGGGLAAAQAYLVKDRFEYDHARRLIGSFRQINNEDEFRVSEMKYNEREELIRKSIGGRDGKPALQDIDYKYNIRGWMTEINDINSNSTGKPIGGIGIGTVIGKPGKQ